MAIARVLIIAAVAGSVALAGCTTAQEASGADPTASARPAATSPSPLGVTTWPGYHATQSRSGAVSAGASLDSATKAWTADLGGAVFGQPVVAGGRIIAATENNRVVALDPSNGTVLWSVTLGTPLTSVDSKAGCGNIDPLGITSTPVIDTTAGIVYVVGEISDGGSTVHHQLEGINIASGSVVFTKNVDPKLPSGEHAVNLLQRAGLALSKGRVYVSYGGNSGDCGHYHGWVVGVDVKGHAATATFEVASNGEGGAIWEAGGAPAANSLGDIYVTTGNANPDPPQGGPDTKRYTESVVRLSSTLHVLASFKDTSAGGDADLGTGNPVLLPHGKVFATGKTDIAFILTQSHLAKVSAIHNLCGSDPDGGPAYYAATNTMFVPCRSGGIQEVNLTKLKLGPKLNGANGAPILIGATVWAAQYPEGTITEFSATTGAKMQTLDVGTSVPHFATPSTAFGLLLIGTDSGVTAFAGAS